MNEERNDDLNDEEIELEPLDESDGLSADEWTPPTEKPFADLRIPLTMLHDAPLDTPGCRLVDIQHVFGKHAKWVERAVACSFYVVYKLFFRVNSRKPKIINIHPLYAFLTV